MTLADLEKYGVVKSTLVRALLLLSLPFALHCGGGEAGDPGLQVPASRSGELVQTCAARTIRGTPIKGTICGGSFITSGCEPGVLYKCQDQGTGNNCALLTTCAVGCATSQSQGSDSCYSGAAPLAVTPTSTPGGSEVTATVTLSEPHANGAIDNMRIDRGDLIAARASCNVLDVPAGSSSVSFNMPSAVVSAATPVRAWTNLSFTAASGFSRQVVSRATTVTLQPGGTAPPPPAIASFKLTPASIAPGGVSFMDVTLLHMAPAQALPAAQGLPIQVTSSNPSVASVIANGQPVITPGCTTGGGAETLQAANTVSQQTVVTVSASSGAPGQSPVTNPLTVTAGCTPKSCLDIPANQCSAPDGCGGTLACGCASGQACGADGFCQAQQQLAVSSITLNPSTVQGGTTSVGTVTLNMPSPPGGSAVFFNTSSSSAQPPSSVVLPEGATSASFNVTTSRVGSNVSATITASLGGQKTAVLTITP